MNERKTEIDIFLDESGKELEKCMHFASGIVKEMKLSPAQAEITEKLGVSLWIAYQRSHKNSSYYYSGGE